MKIFITGGGGYVGSMLAKYLAKEYNITVLDLMMYEPKLFINDEKISVVKGDIRDQDLLKKFYLVIALLSH